MQEDWDNMYASGWWMVVPPSDPPSRSMPIGWKYPQCDSPMYVGSSFWSSIQVPIFGMLIWHTLCWWLGQWRWLVRVSFHRWLTALPAMVPDGLRCDWGTAEALFTHQAKLVVHHPQMVDDSSLILPFLPTPQTVGYPIKMMECVRMVDTS